MIRAAHPGLISHAVGFSLPELVEAAIRCGEPAADVTFERLRDALHISLIGLSQ
ncbi:hypothetical protein [Nocardia miyunensis]|uniref:hypothetical protein n=1 Tax=Nocardia miyunensis TaxID=282684 RepID=UPI000AAD21DA|nr:hypothetical protein [Nocardia miyunensis]